jgi:tetratricopeptide (TPR) repeat protein
VRITVYCPRCNTASHVDPQLRGKRIRCPNPVCAHVFVAMEGSQPSEPEAAETPKPVEEPHYRVRPESEAFTPISRSVQRPGGLGDIIPIVESEAAEDFPAPEAEPVNERGGGAVPLLSAEAVALPPEPSEVASWREPPPVRNPAAPQAEVPPPPREKAPAKPKPPRRPAEPPAPPPPEPQVEMAPTEVAGPPGPVELPPGAWEAPPVRRTPGADAATELAEAPAAVEAPAEHEEPHEEAVPITGRRGRLIVTLLVVAAVAVLGVMVTVFIIILAKHEERTYEHGLAAYKEGRYDDALADFRKLEANYANSPRLPEYRFLAGLSSVRSAIGSVGGHPMSAREELAQFTEESKGSPFLKEYRADLWTTHRELVRRLAETADSDHNPEMLAAAEKTLDRARDFEPSGADAKKQFASARDFLTKAKANLANWQRKQDILAKGQQLLAAKPNVDAVKDWWRTAQQAGLDKDVEATRLHQKLHEEVQRQVRYVKEYVKIPQATDVIEPSLQVVPLVKELTSRDVPLEDNAGKRGLGRELTIPLVARGVLYAVSASDGDVKWTTRVGIDTTALPVRLPRTPTEEEIFLVVSAGPNLLRAIEAQSGRERWRFPLSDACLGEPLVVGRRAYVPTYDGRVYEIEIGEGIQLGYFELNQPLTVGGTQHPNTNLAFFPADSQNVFVLDLEKHECVRILQSGHPSGSLRSAPVVIDRTDPRAKEATGPTGYLVLNQAEGLDAIRLRVFTLPIERPDQPPSLQPEPIVRGWSWFVPYHDPEKLALVTDVGEFAVYGVNQVHNLDPDLFPMYRSAPGKEGDTLHRERAQVVHAAENDFWVLDRGNLQRLHFNRYATRQGDQMRSLWEKSLPLGSPLHSAQRDEGGKTLFVLTRSQALRGIRATAVEADSGRVLWQRHFGLEVQGDPVVLGQDVLAQDRSGLLFRFEPGKHTGRAAWQKGGQRLGDATDESQVAPLLLRSADGKSVYQLAFRGQGRLLDLRRYNEGDGQLAPGLKPELNAPLHGTPALSQTCLVLPLADGILTQIALEGGKRTPGPSWRDARADEQATGHVVYLSGNDFLFTNGLRGLKKITWPAEQQQWPVLQEVTLPARIVAAPVVLRPSEGAAELRVLVATSDENLTLLEGPELKPSRVWKLGGQVTAGLFLRGSNVGCVVGRRRLLWIDPAQDGFAWEYETPGEGIVGRPQLVGEFLLVADVGGLFVGLDPATGKPQGRSYELKAGAAPSATPVAFGPDRAFVPLTDGTVFLLDLSLLRPVPPKEPPPVW